MHICLPGVYDVYTSVVGFVDYIIVCGLGANTCAGGMCVVEWSCGGIEALRSFSIFLKQDLMLAQASIGARITILNFWYSCTP